MVTAITLLPVMMMVVAVCIAASEILKQILKQRHKRKMKVLEHKNQIDREMIEE